MKRFVTIIAVLALAAVTSRAYAQPDQPTGTPPAPPPATGDNTATTAPDAGQPPLTDAMRAAIADEVRKALAEERRKQGFTTSVGDKAKAKDPNADPLGDDDYLTGDSGFFDTRLDFTFVNENVLVKPGETIPSIPGWRFGTPTTLGTLFFDNYDTRYSGYETMSHVTLYKNYRRDHLEVEGGLVLRMNDLSALASSPGTSIIGTNPIALTDDGSYIMVAWWKDPKHVDPHRISVTAFPNSADRFRLGFSYRLSWGGNDEYQNTIGTTNSALPGVKVQFDGGDHYAFVGMKSAIVQDPTTGDFTSKLAFLGGAGVDLGPEQMVRIEANGGYFDKGNNPLVDVQTTEVQLFGASAQIAVHKGMPVTSSLDYKLYKNDPERIGRAFQPVVYHPGETSWLVMSEATLIGQTLKDADKTGSTKIQWGRAGDINARMMIDRWRLRADVSYRDLAFVEQAQPSIPSYTDFPAAYSTASDLFFDAGIDKNWRDRFTLGAVFGVERPASLTAPAGLPATAAGAVTGSQTAVVRNNGFGTIISILPSGAKPEAQIALKGTATVTFGAVFAFLVNVYYSYDPNMTIGTPNTMTGEYDFKFGQLNQLGGDITLQAKF